jgi:hypothetical protein
MDKVEPTNARPAANIVARCHEIPGNCRHSKRSVICAERPDADNSQPWRFAIFRNTSRKQIDRWLLIDEENWRLLR